MRLPGSWNLVEGRIILVLIQSISVCNDIHQILYSIFTLVHPVYDYDHPDYDYPGCDSKRNDIQPGPQYAFDSNWFCIVQQFGIILHQRLSAYRKRLSDHQVTVGDGDALPSIAKYYQVLPSIAKYYQVSPSSTKYCQVMPSIVRYYQVLPSIAKYYQVFQYIIKYYQMYCQV